jgi:hypothetical protein
MSSPEPKEFLRRPLLELAEHLERAAADDFLWKYDLASSKPTSIKGPLPKGMPGGSVGDSVGDTSYAPRRGMGPGTDFDTICSRLNALACVTTRTVLRVIPQFPFPTWTWRNILAVVGSAASTLVA